MIGLYSLIIAAGVAFSTFAITTFNGFSDFQSKTSQLIDYDTTALASSTRIAKESSKFLTDLKLSLNGSSLSEASRPVELINELIDDLELHSENQLNKTISYGLKGKQDYKIELIQSGYIPPKFKDSDKKYASVILSEVERSQSSLRAHRSNLPIDDLYQFISDNKLKISETLLSSLFSDDKVEELKAKQSERGLNIVYGGLSLENLPNGLKLKLNKEEIMPLLLGANGNAAISQEKEYLTRTAIAQIRVGEVEEVISTPVITDPEEPDTKNPVVVKDPCWVFNTCPPPPINVRRLELALEVSPLSNRGFLFDPSSTINGSNPLQIINKKEGGYSSIFVNDNGYLQIAIGSISKKLGNKTKNIEFFENEEMKFDTTTLTFEDTEVPEGKEVIYSEDKKITMAIDAKGRTSYTTVKKAFTLGNGVTVPAGSVNMSISEHMIQLREAY